METNASGDGLGDGLWKARDGMNCECDELPDGASMCPVDFLPAKISNLEWEVQGIIHYLEKFHHYCFAKEVYGITDHKPLVAIVSKDMDTLSKCLQCTMFAFTSIGYGFLYEPGPDLYIVYW